MTIDAVCQFGVSLFASAGIAGIIVGLPPRPMMSNLIAGLQLAITQPIRLYFVGTLLCLWVWLAKGLRTRAWWAFGTMMVAWMIGMAAKYVFQRARPVVEDPVYLTGPLVTSPHFKKEPDGSKWDPTPC